MIEIKLLQVKLLLGGKEWKKLLHNTYHIEDSGERAAHIVESYTHILETQVVECDHAYKNDGER